MIETIKMNFAEYIPYIDFFKIIIRATIYSLFGLYIGLKYPDWDFKFKLRHRSIVTHSFLLILFLYVSRGKTNVESYIIIGLAIGTNIHLAFDLFPYGWNSGAFIKIPWAKITLGRFWSQTWMLISIFINFYIVSFLVRDIFWYITSFIFTLIFLLRYIKKEKKVVRPSLALLVTGLMILFLRYNNELMLFY